MHRDAPSWPPDTWLCIGLGCNLEWSSCAQETSHDGWGRQPGLQQRFTNQSLPDRNNMQGANSSSQSCESKVVSHVCQHCSSCMKAPPPPKDGLNAILLGCLPRFGDEGLLVVHGSDANQCLFQAGSHWACESHRLHDGVVDEAQHCASM